jgi:hypothetical protein
VCSIETFRSGGLSTQPTSFERVRGRFDLLPHRPQTGVDCRTREGRTATKNKESATLMIPTRKSDTEEEDKDRENLIQGGVGG